jgi:putative flippase GtrA
MRSRLPGFELLRYAAVGVANTSVSYATYLCLLAVDAPYAAAATLAFAAGAGTGYLLNRRWTFRAADTGTARARYLAVQLAALALTNGLLWLLVDGAGVPARVAYALAIAPVTLGGYAANRCWTFRASPYRPHSSFPGRA